MNDLVKQLAQQSGLGWTITRAGIQGDTKDLESVEKFAEAIMLECIRAVDEAGYELAGDSIVEHFGLR